MRERGPSQARPDLPYTHRQTALLPGPFFKPMIAQLGQPSLQQLTKVAEEFETSIMATALRLADINILPVIVACYSRDRRCWSLPAADIPKRWFLKDKLDEDTFTYDLLNSGKECRGLGKQSEDAWFENDDAEKYEVLEQCIGSVGGIALVLLYLQADMLYAGVDWNVGNSRYNGQGSYVPRRGSLRR